MFRMFIRTMSTYSIKVRPPISVFGVEGRYVSALYSAASQSNELDKVDDQLQSILPLLHKDALKDFIETSLLSRAAKSKLLEEVGKEAGMSKSAINFLSVVAENGRLKKLRRMITMFHMVMIAHRNEAPCEVITAKPLDDATRSSLMAALKKFVKGNKKIQLTEKVDPSIIGGMVVGVEDKHIDMSISRKVQMYTDILKQTI